MVDFKKALSKDRYDFMRLNFWDKYREIVAFSSCFGFPRELDIAVRAQVEDYCMGLAKQMYQQGKNDTQKET